MVDSTKTQSGLEKDTMGLYDNLKKVHEQEEQNYYSNVRVEVSFSGKSNKIIDLVDGNVRVEYQIDVEYRDFGIKDVNVYPQGEILIDAEVLDDRNNRTSLQIKIDMSKVRVEWIAGSGVQPLDMNILINENGEVDYERSYIQFTYHVPAVA